MEDNKYQIFNENLLKIPSIANFKTKIDDMQIKNMKENIFLIAVSKDFSNLPLKSFGLLVNNKEITFDYSRHHDGFGYNYDASIIDNYPPQEIVDISTVRLI